VHDIIVTAPLIGRKLRDIEPVVNGPAFDGMTSRAAFTSRQALPCPEARDRPIQS
jgi:hypothetical protein